MINYTNNLANSNTVRLRTRSRTHLELVEGVPYPDLRTFNQNYSDFQNLISHWAGGTEKNINQITERPKKLFTYSNTSLPADGWNDQYITLNLNKSSHFRGDINTLL
jgi:hypothetical protein